jgi:hypothetical protein
MSFSVDFRKSSQHQILRKSVLWEPRWYTRAVGGGGGKKDRHDESVGTFRYLCERAENISIFLSVYSLWFLLIVCIPSSHRLVLLVQHAVSSVRYRIFYMQFRLILFFRGIICLFSVNLSCPNHLEFQTSLALWWLRMGPILLWHIWLGPIPVAVPFKVSRMLRSRFWILLRVWLFVSCVCLCYVGKGLCDGAITNPGEC